MPTKKKSGLPLKAGAKANKQTLVVLLLLLVAVGAYFVYRTLAATAAPFTYAAGYPAKFFTISDSGVKTQLFAAQYGGWGLKYSPDKTKLAYIGDEPGGATAIYIRDLAAKKTIKLATATTPNEIAWFPNGLKLAYLTNSGNPNYTYSIYTITPSGTAKTKVSGVDGPSIFNVTVSKDSKTVLYTRYSGDTSSVFSVPVSGGTPKQLTPTTLGSCSNPAPKLTDAWIFVTCNKAGVGSIYKLQISTAPTRVLATASGFSISALQVTGSGRLVYNVRKNADCGQQTNNKLRTAGYDGSTQRTLHDSGTTTARCYGGGYLEPFDAASLGTGIAFGVNNYDDPSKNGIFRINDVAGSTATKLLPYDPLTIENRVESYNW